MSFEDDFDMTEDEFDALWEKGTPVQVAVGPAVAQEPNQQNVFVRWPMGGEGEAQ